MIITGFWWSRDRIYKQWFAKDWHILCVRKLRKMFQSLVCQYLVFSRKIDILQFWEQFKKNICKNKIRKPLTRFFILLGRPWNISNMSYLSHDRPSWHMNVILRYISKHLDFDRKFEIFENFHKMCQSLAIHCNWVKKSCQASNLTWIIGAHILVRDDVILYCDTLYLTKLSRKYEMKRQSESLKQSSTVRPVVSVRRTLVYFNGNSLERFYSLLTSRTHKLWHSGPPI